MNHASPAVALAVSGVVALATPAIAQNAPSVESFYRGNTVTVLIAGTPGGGFDAYSRLMAQHLPRFLPGKPNMVAQNMAGAGGLTLANSLYNVQKRDGTVIAYVGPIAMQPLFNPDAPNTKFDPRRFSWIGSLASSQSLLIEWKTGPIQTPDDLFTKEMVVAGTGAASDTDFYPKFMNSVLGTKFKLITGYVGSQETLKAIEQGEAHGRFMSYDSVKSTRKQWLDDGTLKIIFQNSLKRHPDLPNVVTIVDIAKSRGKGEDVMEALKFLLAPDEMGRPIAGPPGIPAERVGALRTAFAQMVKDPEYLEDARKRHLEPDQPLDGEGVEKLVNEIYQTPKPIIDMVAKAMK
ncbi:MAG: Bug family tripartite tricarboxylate transporter substrate binding protein [Gemmatimonas sp.]